MGDTTVPSAEQKAKEKNPDRMKKKIAMKGLVKGNLSLKTGQKLQVTGPKVDWYLPLIDLTWDEIQSRYSSEPLPNKT